MLIFPGKHQRINRNENLNMKRFLLICTIILISGQFVRAQFGQNKVMYDRFDFDIYKTPHFEIYNYLEGDTAIYNLGQLSERWYLRHKAIYGDTLDKSPIILYNNTTDFKQTTVISGLIGVGTGGVTEGLRSRVVIPVMASNKETDHVLGHEMVHVFQYNTVRNNDSLSFQSLNNTPLWFIEGTAEFLSIGPKDNRTAMWMRDAVIHNDVPTLKDMTRNMYKYFPYRYGHAFMSYISGVWGDDIIQPYFFSTLKYGMEFSTKMFFHIDTDSLSTLWQNAVKSQYSGFFSDTIAPVGELMYNDKNAGEINLSPVLSPDGKNVIFLSNKDVINIDILLAETQTKKIITKLTSTVKKTHIDDFNYIEDAGSWSPDGKKYVFATFVEGTNELLIVNIDNKRINTEKEIRIKGIDYISNPEWSPDGKSILFNGLVNGKSDLYLYNLENDKTKRLTNDYYSDLQPSWSSDGTEIAFISDRGNDTDLKKQVYGTYHLCIYKMNSGQVIVYDFLPGADIYSPQYSPSDSSLYFLSNADGFRNLYRYHLHTGEIFKLTKFATGITGITDLAPAYSVSRESGQVVYTLYSDDKYLIYKANPSDFLNIPVNPNRTNFDAEYLPPGKNRIANIVENNLNVHPSQPKDSFETNAYNSKFELEYIGSSGVGVGYSSYGTIASGGVSALFSDMMKYHQIYAMLQINGEVYDFGGQLAYLNMKNRLFWGASFYHYPYRYMYWETSKTIDENYWAQVYKLVRVFEENLSVFSQYPISTKLRLEGGINWSHYSFRIDSVNYYYQGYYPFASNKTNVDAPDGYNISSAYVAFVGDDSNFGLTSPMDGYRFRFQIGQMMDALTLTNLSLDFRKYYYLKPFGFAFKAMHYGRYGQTGNSNLLYPIFLGNDYLVRGYNFDAFYKSYESEIDDILDINTLTGSKIAVMNAEIRYPFTGPKRFALIKSGIFFTDIVLFLDGGVSWDKDRLPWLESSDVRYFWNPNPNYHTPVYSAGASLRINLFGYMVLEPYIAKPFQLENVPFTTGFIISGGGF
ncbi:MAG TPA: tolB protein precursor [Bacteroidales bacterium]|nr:tolB protein precursor [Bacteroidales bacterium]